MYPHLKDDYVIKRNLRYEYRENENSPAEHRYPSKSKQRLEYLASITCMDEAIGEMLDLLDDYNIADNTIVIFFSDNGGSSGYSVNTPLKGFKAWMFEGGIRVPCIIRYPKKIPAGGVSDEFLTSLEIVPTLMNEAKISLPEKIVFDGFDMMPVLTGKTTSPRDEMFWQRRNDKAARVGNWKWVESAKGNGLFNLDNDIGEAHDLSEEYPDKFNEMKQHFANWKERMDNTEPRGPFRDY